MIKVTDEIKISAENLLKDYKKKVPMSALQHEIFLSNLLPYIRKNSKVEYPRTIKVAKPLDKLILGDFEPDYEIVINSPVMYKGNEIWLGDASKKLDIHFGYLNGDKRYFSEYALDAQDKPHGFLGGSTGSGKSVCLNQIMFNWFFEYAPWELDVTLSDAKISEFKPYGLQHHIPHIHSISATEDPLYLASVFTKFHADMKMFNEVLTQVNAKTLEDFRENTGLMFPRHILVADELNAMFRGLPNYLKNLIKTKIIDIGALGRSAGYNLIGASQNIDGSLSDFVEHMPVRMCLKCNQSFISEKILGNDQGAVGDVGMGKIYVNDETASKSKEDNTKFRVPLQNKVDFQKQGDFLEKAGIDVGYKSYCSFYNESDKLMEPKLKEICNGKKYNPSVVIGEPSFISSEPSRLEIKFDNDDVANLLVYTPLTTDLHRYFRTMYNNALSDRDNGRKVNHKFFIADRGLLSAGSSFTDLKDIDPKSDGFSEDTIKSTVGSWEKSRVLIYIKLLIITADQEAFELMETDDDSTEFYINNFSNENVSEIAKARAHSILKLLEDPGFTKPLGMDSLNGEKRKSAMTTWFRLAFNVIKMLGSNFIETKVTKEDLPVTVFHVVGAQRINGFGRDSNLSKGELSKKMLQDCYESNTFFIIYTSSIEYIADMLPGFKYCILDKIKDPSRLKCQEYPENVRSVCGVLYEIVGGDVKTFKRLSLGISD